MSNTRCQKLALMGLIVFALSVTMFFASTTVDYYDIFNAITIIDIQNDEESFDLVIDHDVNISAFKQDLFHRSYSNLYPKYYYYESFNSTIFFNTHCSLNHASWAKSMQAHYFMNQLTENRFNTRVYQCNKADIFVIPLSLGYAMRGYCKKNITELHNEIITSINNQLFNDKNSCWNKYPQSQHRHFIMLGDFKGRNDIKHNRKTMFYNKWYNFAMADIDRKHWKDSIKCVVPSGHVSIASKLSNSHYAPIFNDISSWKSRSYDLFFMGQADSRRAYKMRNVLLKGYHNRNSNNILYNKYILIQTKVPTTHKNSISYINCPSSILLLHNESSYYNDNYFPCTLLEHNQDLYLQLLPKSKFSLMIRGDDSCSSRFWDAISLNVINIVISDNFEDCLIGYEKDNKWIPWNKMFLRIPENQFEKNPSLAIDSLLSKYSTQYFENMLQLIHLYKKHILWDTAESIVAHNILYNTMKVCPAIFKKT